MRLSLCVARAASTTHSFSSSVNCKNAFPLNANATRRQSRKLSSKRDQNPENSRGIKGEDICGEHVSEEHSCLMLPDSKTGRKAVHLNPPARDVLHSIPRLEGNPYVICGEKAHGI